MIMPNKHVAPRDSLIGLAGRLLRHVGRPRTVSALWERVRDREGVRSFDRFVLAVDLLFVMGVVELVDGRVRRVVE